jgi:hypothetical protein
MINNELLSDLDYDPETGVFTWIVPKRGRVMKPLGIGRKTWKGYWRITLNGKDYKAHRLAWLFMTGEWPADQIDHINCDKLDNRWCNLRPANNSQNHMNAGPRSNNSSGVPGVSWDRWKGRWQVRITKDYKNLHIGYFDDFSAARAARVEAEARVFGEYARPV